MQVDDTVRAYAAGLVDGEGSIQLNPVKGQAGKRYWGLTVQVSNNYTPVLTWLQSIYGGSVTTWQPKKAVKPHYNWRLYSTAAEYLLADIQPFVRIKQQHIQIALEFRTFTTGRGYVLTPEATIERERCAKEMRLLNSLHRKATAGDFPVGVL